MVLETVFALVLWNGQERVRERSFPAVQLLSRYQTEPECLDALKGYGAAIEEDTPLGKAPASIPIISCEKVTRLKITGTKIVPPGDTRPRQSWLDWWQSH